MLSESHRGHFNCSCSCCCDGKLLGFVSIDVCICDWFWKYWLIENLRMKKNQENSPRENDERIPHSSLFQMEFWWGLCALQNGKPSNPNNEFVKHCLTRIKTRIIVLYVRAFIFKYRDDYFNKWTIIINVQYSYACLNFFNIVSGTMINKIQ